MSRFSRRHNLPKVIGLGIGLTACIAGLGIFAMQASGTRSADEYGCFSGIAQPQTIALIDASDPRWNPEQALSLTRYFNRTYYSLSFNERLSFYTTEGDVLGSEMTPRFHVCGQATSPDQLEAVNAASGNSGYLTKQKKRLYLKKLVPELETLLSDSPDEARRQSYQSPILEMIADVSRNDIDPGSRLILVSDLLQNSDSLQFCRTQNHMPPFDAFKKRLVYQRLKPRSLEGVEVEILMLQRFGYGQNGLDFCHSEEELMDFYRTYFLDNGTAEVRFIRIRHGRTEC